MDEIGQLLFCFVFLNYRQDASLIVQIQAHFITNNGRFLLWLSTTSNQNNNKHIPTWRIGTNLSLRFKWGNLLAWRNVTKERSKLKHNEIPCFFSFLTLDSSDRQIAKNNQSDPINFFDLYFTLCAVENIWARAFDYRPDSTNLLWMQSKYKMCEKELPI